MAFLKKDQDYVKEMKKNEQQSFGSSSWFGLASSIWNKVYAIGSSTDFALDLTPDVWKELYSTIEDENFIDAKRAIPKEVFICFSRFNPFFLTFFLFLNCI
jgi:hypothetical protein